MWQRAIQVWEHVFGPQHVYMAAPINDLAEFYMEFGRYDEAQPLAQRALAIWEQALGPSNPHVAISLHNLARLYIRQEKYEQAES